MQKLSSYNLDGELITVDQACQLSNLGAVTVRRLANKAGAIRKIGRSCRINRRIFFEFVENECAHKEDT